MESDPQPVQVSASTGEGGQLRDTVRALEEALSAFDLTGDTEALRTPEVLAALDDVPQLLVGLKTTDRGFLRHLAGQVSYLRSTAVADEDRWGDFAAAIKFFDAALADSAATILPEELWVVLGPARTPEGMAMAGGSLLEYCQEYDDADALDLAVQLLGCAADKADEAGAARASYRAGLSTAYVSRYYLHARRADLVEAIRLGELVRTDPALSADERFVALSTLAVACRARFELDRAEADIDTAIEAGREAARLAPPEYRGDLLAALGSAHQLRYEDSRDVADLDAAVVAGESAVEASPEDEGLQADLGMALKLRFDRLGDRSDLSRAIEYTAHAADVTSSDLERIGYLVNLSTYHRTAAESSEDPAEASSAVEQASKAVVIDTPNHHLAMLALGTLGKALLARYQVQRDDTDLDLALRHLRTVTDGLQPGDAGLASWLAWLARACEEALDAGKEVDPGLLTELSAMAELDSAATPRQRATASGRVGMVMRLAGLDEVASRLLRRTVELLPKVAPGWQDLASQSFGLEQPQAFLPEAVSAELQLNRAEAAVELAELGRGVLLSTRFDLGTGIAAAGSATDHLVTQFFALRRQLAAPQADLADLDPDGRLAETARRRELDAEAGRLLDQVRRTAPDFLATPSMETLQAAAGDGTIVLVNASTSRGDAVLIRADREPRVVPLPDLDGDEVAGRAQELTGAFGDRSLAGGFRRRRVVPDVLAWAWGVITAPVLDELGPSASPLRRDRVWWIPVGALAAVPLHASGLPGSGENVLDHVVSSIAPTLRALAHARRQDPVDTRRLLAVAVTESPGHPPLPHTVEEARSLGGRFEGPDPLVDERATRAAVLTALHDASWVHFACHAVEDPLHAAGTGLVLADQVLSIQELIAERGIGGELAYLSACSTSRSSRNPDELIHLASAFQLAGYRHVVGTLWPVADDITARVAHQFYESMESVPTADSAATVLNDVLRDLRQHEPERSDLWSPFVHVGP
jgi:tetratricopeptide (TPR) repeat protein